ncbi:hypothetical protein C477_07031 [Haloterrigena salina JCM 13891]|uniref:Uncharacterized protein n=1 Tax=Haloterrigena salina JCM 13891 TaxID=1227488 RepID=M0CCR5_9EURY|nr:hypothetical protein C477_07031 [Haloterrigena salina JCM 13891]
MERDPDDLELSDVEADALHELQLGIEYVHRAYGTLLEFHHELGHAMDRMGDAEDASARPATRSGPTPSETTTSRPARSATSGPSNSSRSSPRSS